ncbi:TPA: hypothetical protein DCP42_00075 [Patescibacteria group bacterium]|nr:hypothetical protein [Patescibacteria group bacterium]
MTNTPLVKLRTKITINFLVRNQKKQQSKDGSESIKQMGNPTLYLLPSLNSLSSFPLLIFQYHILDRFIIGMS